jgi:hypothetical protein
MNRTAPAVAVGTLLIGLALIAACSSEDPAPAGDNTGEYMPLISSQEAGELMQQCMSNRGWEVELNEFAELESNLPDESQSDEYNADIEACWGEHDLDKPPRPMDQATAEAYFDLLVESAGCLEDLGFSISEPPSRETYVEQLASADSLPWDPFADIVELVTGEEWDEARRACPQPERPDIEQ